MFHRRLKLVILRGLCYVPKNNKQAFFLAQRVVVLQPVAVVCDLRKWLKLLCRLLWICITVLVIALETDRQRYMKATL